MVVSGRKLGLIAAVGLVLVAPLFASCTGTPSTSSAETTLTTTSSSSPAPSTILQTSSTPSTESDSAAWLGTTSTATLPASAPAFHRELSGADYYCAMVHTVPQGAQGWTPPGKLGPSNTAVMEVLVWVDPDRAARATYDLIYDHAITLAKKHGIADSTGGWLRVVLFDAAPGEFIGEHIIESKDFDLRSATSLQSTTVTTKLFPAIDSMLGRLRLDVKPREGVRVAVGGLREVPWDELDPRKRLIEGEIIIENHSDTPFACGPDDFRLYVGPFQTQIEGMTASTDFPVQDAVLAPTSMAGHEFMREDAVAPGHTLHGYLLTWIADRGTESYGLQYDPSDVEARKVGRGYMNRIQP